MPSRDRSSAGVGGNFTASPWAYDGKIFCLSEEGTTYVVKAGAKFELLGKNVLGEVALATPAVADGRLFVRTATNLYCIQKPATPDAKKP
jgi:outer membrane protein assembly factor BamB